MAHSIEIARGGSTAKVRNPWGVLGLTFLTLGIYLFFWWYFVNRELRDLGRSRGVDLGQSPGTSVLAMTLGALIIVPPFVSAWNTGRRLQDAQVALGIQPAGTKPLFFFLHIFSGVGGAVYGQYMLNQIWDRVDGRADDPPALSATPTHIGDFQTPGSSAPVEAQRSFGDPDR
jgi:hypothetical protein